MAFEPLSIYELSAGLQDFPEATDGLGRMPGISRL